MTLANELDSASICKLSSELTSMYCRSRLLALALSLASPLTMADDRAKLDVLEAQLEAQGELIREQREMLEAMRRELERVKAARGTPVVVEEALDASAPPTRQNRNEAGSDNDVRTRSSAQLYGHIQLDAIYDLDRVDPTWESTFRPSTIPTVPGEFGSDGNTTLSIKQTQLGTKLAVPTPVGDLKGWLEFDLFGTGSDAGDTAFNIRHAWVEVGGLGFGQTNSTFMDVSIFPNVVDWWGPSGMVFNRNPQLRYTFRGEAGDFAVALEKPNGSFNTGVFGDISPELDSAARAKTEIPDLTAHWRSERDWGHVQIAGVLRRLEFELVPNTDDDALFEDTGWGINLTGVANITDLDRLKLGVVYGEGIGSFMNDGGVNLAPQNFEEEAVPLLGLTAYYDHYWSPQLSSSIGFSLNDPDSRNQQAADEFERGLYSSVNLLYAPYPELLIGSELLYGEHEDVGGGEGDALRVQFSFKHRFSTRF